MLSTGYVGRISIARAPDRARRVAAPWLNGAMEVPVHQIDRALTEAAQRMEAEARGTWPVIEPPEAFFRTPEAALASAVEIVERAPALGLKAELTPDLQGRPDGVCPALVNGVPGYCPSVRVVR